jgi:hypothetical protein
MNRIKVFKNAVDISDEMEDYLFDSFSTTLLDTDEISIGYYKPINAIFLELLTSNTVSSKTLLYYYNGTSFITTPAKDETKGFSRNGFISWDRNLINEVKTTVNGIEMFWYKLKLDVTSSALVIAGLNLVFSSDRDLTEEYPTVLDMIPEGKTSFIGFHVASRKDILSYFRSMGKLLENPSNGTGLNNSYIPDRKYVDQFDLLNYEEIRDASKFLTLSKILYWVSDAVEDNWFQKAKKFEEKYNAKINIVNLSLDDNDNGKSEKSEVIKTQTIRIERV